MTNNAIMTTQNITQPTYIIRDVADYDLPEIGDLLQVVRIVPIRDGWLGAQIVLEPLGVRLLEDDMD